MTADQLRECRDAFEKWLPTTQGWKTCKMRGKPFSLRSHISGEYADFRVNDRWHAYLSAWNTRPTAVASHADGEAVAWMHTLHMELGQSSTRLSLSIENPFGIAGEDYSSSYSVTSRPLYAHPARSGDEARDAAYLNLLAASKTYFIRYCVDEADEDPQWTGCSEQQSIDARELRDAISAAMAARGDDK